MKEKHILTGFLAVACAIGIAEWRTPAMGDDNVIVVTPELREFVQTQVASAGKGSVGNLGMDAEQALALAIEEEMLYREGMRLGLDQDDLIVKRRVVQKMRFLLEASTPLDEPAEQQLQAYLDEHPEQFMHDAQLQFEHRFFARSSGLDDAVARAKATPAGASDPHPFNALNAPIGLRQLQRELGKPAADSVTKLTIGQWSEPITSGMGVHLIKLTAYEPAQKMTVAEAGLPLRAAVKEAQRERMNEAALAAIESRYKIERADSTFNETKEAKP